MVMGFLLRTPQIEIASALLVVAAHVTHHFFAAVGKPLFESQDGYRLCTVLLVLVTYLGAYLWERYLRRVGGRKVWEQDIIVCIPYLGATFLLATELGRGLEGIYIPLAQNGLGLVLLVISGIIAYSSVRTAGVFALGIGSASFFTRLYSPAETALSTESYFLPCVGLMLITYTVGERALLSPQRQGQSPSRFDDTLRTALVATAGALGILAVNEWADKANLTLFWLGHAMAGLCLGAAFREARYLWAALLILAIAILRALRYDLRILPQPYQYVAGAVLVTALVILGWAYAWGRLRKRRLSDVDQARGMSSDG